MKIFTTINFYIAKEFFIKFLQIIFGFSLLIFIINLVENVEDVREAGAPISIAFAMSFLQIVDFLNDIASSLVLIAAIIAFFTLSSRSEITILRSSGMSLWQVLMPIATTSFLIGIFWVTAFSYISIKMTKTNEYLENKYFKNDERQSIAPKNGIWLKQNNQENLDEEIIIQAKKVYRKTVEFSDVKIWFFDKKYEFYKKIDAKKLTLIDKSWIVENAILNDDNNINKNVEKIIIPTDLQADFIMEKIVNNFQNVKLFTLFEMPQMIENLRSSGFSTTKFIVYFNSLLSKPILFLAMSLIACYFGLNHIRSNNSIVMIFLGIILGLVLYIASSVINSLGSSGLIPTFAATWVIAIISLAFGVLLIYKKEHL